MERSRLDESDDAKPATSVGSTHDAANSLSADKIRWSHGGEMASQDPPRWNQVQEWVKGFAALRDRGLRVGGSPA